MLSQPLMSACAKKKQFQMSACAKKKQFSDEQWREEETI